MIFGRNPVLEAARAGRLETLYRARGLEADPRLEEMAGLAKRIRLVSLEDLDRLVGGLHQGVAAKLTPRRLLSLEEVIAAGSTLLVALDGVEDPQNLGAILRSAEACGVGAVIVPERRSAPLSAAAVKASSGASEHIPLCRVPGLASAIPVLQRAGYWCVAVDPAGETLPWDFDFSRPVCLVLGGEGKGLHRLVKERCEVGVRLPMRGRVASLNVSAAAAALLYEVTRQREAGRG